MAEEHILSSVLHGIKDLRIESQPLPPPAPTELQVAIRATTLCGSDLHYYNHYRNGDIIVTSPLALGHESSGEVVAVGEIAAQQGWAPGDRVALEVGIPCGTCARCLDGRYNICPTLRFRSSAKSTPHFWGTLQSRINHPAQWCHRLPETVSYRLGALVEPLSVALHATSKRSSIWSGARVVVIGAGPVGLLIAACAGLAGASRVLVTDINPGRVAFAKEKGWATHTFVPPPPSGSRPMAIEDRLAASKAGTRDILEAIGSPDGVDFVYECTGVESCVQTGIYAARAGGTLILVGMGNPVMTLPISAAALREVDIKGGFRYANSYPLGIELLASGRLDPVAIESLVTNSFEGLKSVEDAFTMAGRQKDDDGNIVVKVEVTFSD